MNLTMRQRSDLVRAAEHAHNQRPRPRMADAIVCAEPNNGGRSNSLLDQAYKAMARAAFHQDLIVVAVCVIAILVVRSFT